MSRAESLLNKAALAFIIAIVIFALIGALAPAINWPLIVGSANAVTGIAPIGPGPIEKPIVNPPIIKPPIGPTFIRPPIIVTATVTPTPTPMPAPVVSPIDSRFVLPGRLPSDLHPVLNRDFMVPVRPHFNFTVSTTPVPNNTSSTAGNATISLTREGLYVTEGGSLALLVTRWGGAGPVSFKITATDGTAKLGTDVLWQDYYGQSDNASDQFIAVTLPATYVNNGLNDSGKYFYIWLDAISPADTEYVIKGTTVTIMDNGVDVGVPVMNFSSSTYDVTEGDTAIIPIPRSGGVGPAWVEMYVSILDPTVTWLPSDARLGVDFNIISETTYSTADGVPATVEIPTFYGNYSETSTKRLDIWLREIDPTVLAEPKHAVVYIHATNGSGPTPTPTPASTNRSLSVGTRVSDLAMDTYVLPNITIASPKPSEIPAPTLVPIPQPTVIDGIVNAIKGIFGLK